LHTALATLSKLLAPAMPFLAEELHQNLVRSSDPLAPESVHLCSWPDVDPALLDERLNREMRLVMDLASLGHSARNQAAIKVRQPLAEVAFAVARPEERPVLQAYADLLLDELNVKSVRLLGSAGEAVAYSLKPLPKQLGQKYKGQFPKVAAAILELDPEPAAQALMAGQPVRVKVEGLLLDIQPEEVEVRMEARSGLVVASQGGYLAALKTDLTPALLHEGMAREFVRRVQDLRKQAGLEVADRIQLYASATPELAAAIQAHRATIMGETLARELFEGSPPQGAFQATAEFDGESVTFGVLKAS
jgi:isoleucyl-tRNA synthetase